jgi:hypothetical protein
LKKLCFEVSVHYACSLGLKFRFEMYCLLPLLPYPAFQIFISRLGKVPYFYGKRIMLLMAFYVCLAWR